MPFHIEIRRSFRRAWAFNLDEPRLTAIVDRWRRGEIVALGEQEWDPRDSRLTILEGPHLDPPDLGVGMGWPNAERTGSDVSERFLGSGDRPAVAKPVALVVLARDDDALDALAEQIAAAGFEASFVRVDPSDPAATQALVERLRAASR